MELTMAIINKQKALEEIQRVLDDTTNWLENNEYIQFSTNADEVNDYSYHQGKEDAYHNVLSMLAHNVRIRKG